MIGRALVRTGLALATLAGRLSHAVLPWRPWLAAVRVVFPERPLPEARALAREVYLSHVREQYLRLIAPFGLRALAALVGRAEAPLVVERLRERKHTLLVFFHLGPPGGASAGLERLALPAVVLARAWRRLASRHLVFALAADASSGQAAALKRCLDHLGTGGLVLVPLDEDLKTGVAVPLLGREVRVGKGAGALARLSSAPAFPVTADLGGGEIDFRVHETPIVAGEGADAFERAAIAWFERFLRENPRHLRPAVLEVLATALPLPAP